MNDWLWFAAAYLVGAIPTSYLAGKLGRRIDLREHGSKNLGATNTYRVLGWKYAIPVGLFDVAKGAAPVALFGRWSSGAPWVPVALGAAAVAGGILGCCGLLQAVRTRRLARTGKRRRDI